MTAWDDQYLQHRSGREDAYQRATISRSLILQSQYERLKFYSIRILSENKKHYIVDTNSSNLNPIVLARQKMFSSRSTSKGSCSFKLGMVRSLSKVLLSVPLPSSVYFNSI